MELDLSKFRVNLSHSQNGEDGIVEKLFELLKINSGFLVEVGAHDGVFLSNTRHHYTKNPNFKTVLIEAEKSRFEQLTKNVPWNDNNILLNIEVQAEGESSLNAIFEKYNVQDIALLSIDVDGEDLNIFKKLDTQKYQPAIIIIEEGNWKSPLHLTNLSKAFSRKGYNLVHVTGNFIFVHEKYNVKATETIHKFIRKSGHPDVDLYFKKIDEVKYDEIVSRMETDKNVFLELAEEQLIEFEE